MSSSNAILFRAKQLLSDLFILRTDPLSIFNHKSLHMTMYLFQLSLCHNLLIICLIIRHGFFQLKFYWGGCDPGDKQYYIYH